MATLTRALRSPCPATRFNAFGMAWGSTFTTLGLIGKACLILLS